MTIKSILRKERINDLTHKSLSIEEENFICFYNTMVKNLKNKIVYNVWNIFEDGNIRFSYIYMPHIKAMFCYLNLSNTPSELLGEIDEKFLHELFNDYLDVKVHNITILEK